MTLDDFILKLKEIENELPEKVNELMSSTLDVKNTTSAVSLMKKRVFVDGTNSQGSAFTPYSSGYKKVREKYGRQTGKKDFNATNTLNPQIKAFVEDKKLFVGVENPDTKQAKTLSGSSTNATMYDILSGAEKREGENIMMFNEREIEKIKEGTERELVKYIKKYFGL